MMIYSFFLLHAKPCGGYQENSVITPAFQTVTKNTQGCNSKNKSSTIFAYSNVIVI